jgi:hypothetical protein
MEDILLEIAEKTDEFGTTRIQAAAKLHAIYEGQPIARQVSTTVDDVSALNDLELTAELARIGGVPPEADPRGPKASKPH